jgi:HK97 family phage major capsid protein/HK97 family phage prohead protease
MSDRITFAATVTAEGRRIRGAVTLAGSRTWRNNEWLEVDPAALVAADASDVVARWEHDPHKILGRTTNATVSLSRTDQGFSYETAELPNTSYANDALELVRGGYVTGSSFEIDGIRSEFSTDPDGTRIRRIVHIDRLLDVSPTGYPAFAESTAAAFTKESEMTEPTTDTKEPEVPAPAPAQAASQPATVSETFSAAEKLARDTLRDSGSAALEIALDNVIAQFGENPSASQREQYDAFAKVYDEHKAAVAEAKQRRDNLKLAHDMRRGKMPKAPDSGVFESDDYREAFASYLRGNTNAMAQFAQTVSGDGTQGGFMVPDGFVAKLTERLKAFGGIAEAAEEITTSTGESLRWPYIDDTANKAVIAAEDVQAASGADLVFDSIELGAFEYDATGASGNPVEVSLSLIQDAAFDIEDLLTRLLGKRIGRKQADHLATGMGGTEPVGLLSKSADTMTATVASLAAPEHIFQVDSEYRNSGNARWVMSDTTLAKLWSAQATTNEPLFQPGRTLDGKPFDMLFGFPVSIDPAAGNLVAFGDIEAGYIVRRVRGIQLLVDPYTANKRRAVTYHAWARMDANIQDPNAYSVSSWSGVSADT